MANHLADAMKALEIGRSPRWEAEVKGVARLRRPSVMSVTAGDATLSPLPFPRGRGDNRGDFRSGKIQRRTLWAFIFGVLFLAIFLLPDTGRADRLADESQPPPIASPQLGAPATANKSAATFVGRPAAAASSVPATPPPPPPSAPTTPETKTAATGGADASSSLQPDVPQQSDRHVTIDFDNVDIQVFIKFVSELTGRNFVIDDRVKGRVTIISPKKIAVDEVYKLFESVMEIYGFTTIPAGDVIKVIPALDARGKNLETRVEKADIAPADRMVTQIFALQHASPDEMKKVLDPLVSKNSIVLSYPPTRRLIITDVLSNIKRLQEIINALDVDGVGEEITYVPLKYSSAIGMARSLTALYQSQAGKGAISPIKVVADERTNALIIQATENDMVRVRELLDLMDREMPRGEGAIRVYYLQNAKAEDLLKVLTNLPQQNKSTATQAQTGAAAATSTVVFSKNVQIAADKATNALIITADPADYIIIENVIKQLDITRSMVYLEALIMEVNASKSFGIGVEWSLAKDVGISQISDLGGSSVGIAGFKGSTSIIPQIDSTTGSVSLPSGFSLGIIGAGITIGGVTFPNIGAVLQAYKNDTDVRILSTPQLLTLDNEDAEITVGSNVPYVTRQDTTTTSTTNYSSYEYKDVGVTLKMTPQINKDGFIRMKIDQSVTKVISQSAALDSSGSTLALAPTTLKRTAKTTVSVKSGETVVIGGMIQDDSEYGSSRVPLLGDIPLVGWLFKTKSTTNQRTNLFIFITPRIVEKPDDAGKIRDEKSEYMRVIREGTVKNRPLKEQIQRRTNEHTPGVIDD